ncbi:MAG: acetyl-CoA carboxylase, carboxyltransferase subunit beta [Bdellovibrionales bacterium]
MNWITNFVRPTLQKLVNKKDVPDNLWTNCPGCSAMLFHRELDENDHVCRHCGYHLRLAVDKRLKLLYDGGTFTEIPLPAVVADPLKFKDQKRYADRMKDSQSKTGRKDALVIAKGTVGGKKLITAAFDFAFMGGSMGMAVGSGIVAAAEAAVRENAGLLLIPASGGARMQEGILSLMQMPRTIAAISRVKKAGLPYLVLLTDPTTGGVTASFAMVGDIHLAEPGCLIGFAGARVIESTIREVLPQGFQRAEYLLDHGMVDMIVARKDQHKQIAKLLDLLMQKQAPVAGLLTSRK